MFGASKYHPIIECSAISHNLHPRNADKSGKKWLKEMIEYGWKMYGMRMIVFEGHYNKQGDPVYST